MNSFADKILSKYPEAIISTDELGNIIATRNVNGFQILGCSLCFDDDIKMFNGRVMVQDKELIPVSSISEDDSLNPAMKALFFCPVCSRMIILPKVDKVSAKVFQERKN